MKEFISDETIEKTLGTMDTDRTNDLFDSLIHRSKVLNKAKGLDGEEMKKANTVLKAGNLHVQTANTKIRVLKLAGFRDSLKKLKEAAQRKVRDEAKSAVSKKKGSGVVE